MRCNALTFMRIQLKSMTTMAEVAKEAGVSITTVSHALNGTRRVSVKTAERIQAAVDRTGYHPNSIARALAGARTHSIGVAISGISNPNFMNVIAAIEAEAADRGHTILLGDTHDEPTKELQMVKELCQRRVDGILLAPSPHDEATLEYLAQQTIPVVLVDRFVDADIDQVGTENEGPAAQLVAHLISLGHRRIGLIAGLEGLSTTAERSAGYRRALEEADIHIDPSLIVSGASRHDPARDVVHRVLSMKDPPTALVTANNAMTIGALHALRELDLSVPGDVALVAFDDFEWSDLFYPRLTVIAQPAQEIGILAVDLLLSRLDEPDRTSRVVRLPPAFVHRESCGCEHDLTKESMSR